MKKIYLLFIQSICTWGLIVCFAAGMLLMNHHALEFQRNVIGILYQTDETMSREYLYALYADISEENLQASEEAFEAFGFTKQGLSYLGDSMGLVRKCAPAAAAELLLFLAVLYTQHRKQCLWKREKQKLEARIQELEQAQMQEDFVCQQNKRIQNFIENIAHQIKTPISRVYSSLYMIEEGGVEKRERIEECYAHLESVSVLVKRLMDIGKLEAGKVIFKKEKINFEELLEDVVKSCTDEETAVKVALQRDVSGEYYGDYDWLKEAFMNIVNNALEHDKSGKALEITCKYSEEQVKVTIKDHGPGLGDKDIPNLFDRFYLPEHVKTTHTGIGLNLAKLIFEGHFGTVYAYNHAEGGAVFHVILPLYSLKIRRSV